LSAFLVALNRVASDWLLDPVLALALGFLKVLVVTVSDGLYYLAVMLQVD
jgi:hypothetical protein